MRRTAIGLFATLTALSGPGCGDTGAVPAGGANTQPAVTLPPPAETRREGNVTITPTGLRHETLAEGEGDPATAGATVTVHYVGTLEDGQAFEDSRSKDGPITFRLGSEDVLQGLSEGIEGMKVGERRRLELPSHLAYGALGRMPTIPPNATLTFEVELLKVE